MEYLKKMSKTKCKQIYAKKNIHICKGNKYNFSMKKSVVFTKKLINFKRPSSRAFYNPSRRSLTAHLKLI